MRWPQVVCLSLEWIWFAAGMLCLAGAALFSFPGMAARLRIPRGRLPPSLPWWIFGLGLPACICLFKLAQYHAFQLMWDSGVYGNLVWNAAHGFGLRSSVLGEQPYLAVHFTLFPYILAPALRLWETVQVLAVTQGIAMGSCLLAAFLIAKDHGPDEPAAPWALAALTASSIYFHDLVGAVLDNSLYAPAFFLWGAYFFLRGRTALALLFAGLLLTTREHAPFMLAGWGVYLAASRRGRARWLGLALALGCAALWFAEISLIRDAQSAWSWPSSRPSPAS